MSQAYNLLTTKYLQEPTEEEIKELSLLFKEWIRSKNEALLVSIFDIIDTHESEQIRELALSHLKRFLPANKREQVLDLWITHPLPSIRGFVEEIVDEYQAKIKTPTLMASYAMLGQYEKIEEMDPDLTNLDNYLHGLDPLLGSLLVDRVVKLKSRRSKSSKTITEDTSNLSLVDLLGRKDYETLWEKIFSYPFPFVCELIKIFHENQFIPRGNRSKEVFELVTEYLGTDGWEGVEDILYQAISVQDPKTKKFRKLNTAELRARTFAFNLSPEIYTRPDRIPNQAFVSRGRFNLVDPDLNLSIYDETVRHSPFTNNLHVPIYSQNGVLLLEFVIQAPSLSSFQMDEDGLYFTIRIRDKLYSIDVDTLAAFLLPINQYTESLVETVQLMHEQIPPSLAMVVQGLELLLDLHIGRSYSLFDVKEELETPKIESLACCGVGFDFGNTSTKISTIPFDCDHEVVEREYPNYIHYKSGREYLVSYQVEEAEVVESAQTYHNVKRHILSSSTFELRVQNTSIDSLRAGKDLLSWIIKDFIKHLEYQPKKVAFSYPEFATTAYKLWLQEILNEAGFQQIYAYEDTMAAATLSYRLYKTSDPTLIIDIGDVHTSIGIYDIPKNQSRKRLLEKLYSEHQDPPKVVVKRFIDEGSQAFNNHIWQTIEDAWGDSFKSKRAMITQNLKHNLAENFEASLSPSSAEMEEIKFILEEEAYEGELDNIEYMKQFKETIRNVLALAHHRKIEKSQIQNVILSGQGCRWPIFGKIIAKMFEKKVGIIFEDDLYTNAKGLALLSDGQPVAGILDQDIMIRINENGIMVYAAVLRRGEQFSGKAKVFKMEKDFPFNNVVVDIWSRKTKTRSVDEGPVLDEEEMHFSKTNHHLFLFDRLLEFPIMVETRNLGEPSLSLGMDDYGWLVLQIAEYDEEDTHNFQRIVPLL